MYYRDHAHPRFSCWRVVGHAVAAAIAAALGGDGCCGGSGCGCSSSGSGAAAVGTRRAARLCRRGSAGILVVFLGTLGEYGTVSDHFRSVRLDATGIGSIGVSIVDIIVVRISIELAEKVRRRVVGARWGRDTSAPARRRASTADSRCIPDAERGEKRREVGNHACAVDTQQRAAR